VLLHVCAVAGVMQMSMAWHVQGNSSELHGMQVPVA
jgi:hypothetical protein